MLLLFRAFVAVVFGLVAAVVFLAFALKGKFTDGFVWLIFLGWISSAICPDESELQIIVRVFTEKD